MNVSIVIPAYNEEENVEEQYSILKKRLENSEIINDYEIIFIDDGSTDSTYCKLSLMQNSGLRLIRFDRNKGQSAALYTGFQEARFDIIVTLDADLQYEVNDIVSMLEKIKDGYDCVCGWRANRHDSLTKVLSSKVANAARRFILNDKFQDIGCALRVFRRSSIEGIEFFEGIHRFLPYLIERKGYGVFEYKVGHYPRKYGKSKYNVRNRIFEVVAGLYKIQYAPKVLLLILLCLFSFCSFHASAEEPKDSVTISVFPDVLVNEYFYGFGAETLPWLWSKENKEVGVDDEDIVLNIDRIRDMQMPLTRIFVPWEVWNPTVDYKTFTWDSDEMRSLYNVLDLYQEMGTKVILVTVDWLKDSPWRDTEGSSRAVMGLLEYLLKDKGYSCIQFWTLTNEPELTYGWLKKMPFENYVEIHQLVKKGLEEKGLSVKIIASDEVESSEWFEKSVQSLLETADVFSSHSYFYPQDVDLISDFFKKRLGMVKNTPFFLSEFGFRGSDFGACTNDLIDDYEYGVYVSDLCVEALNSGVDAASLWCLHQIRLLDEIEPEGGRMMRIGLWAFKDENWRPFPIFYIYRLFTRYIKSGSKVLKIETAPSNILKAACVEYRGMYSLIIVNMTDEKQSFLINGIEPSMEFKKYLYSSSEISSAQKGSLKGEIPPESVLFYTNLL